MSQKRHWHGKECEFHVSFMAVWFWCENYAFHIFRYKSFQKRSAETERENANSRKLRQDENETEIYFFACCGSAKKKPTAAN